MFFLPSMEKRRGRYGGEASFFIFFSLDEYLVFGLMKWYDIMSCIFSY